MGGLGIFILILFILLLIMLVVWFVRRSPVKGSVVPKTGGEYRIAQLSGKDIRYLNINSTTTDVITTSGTSTVWTYTGTGTGTESGITLNASGLDKYVTFSGSSVLYANASGSNNVWDLKGSSRIGYVFYSGENSCITTNSNNICKIDTYVGDVNQKFYFIVAA